MPKQRDGGQNWVDDKLTMTTWEYDNEPVLYDSKDQPLVKDKRIGFIKPCLKSEPKHNVKS